MAQYRFASPQFREVLKDLAEARLHSNHAGRGDAWWQIEGAMRELGHRSCGEKNSRSNPRYEPRLENARPIPAGSVEELFGGLPSEFDREARRAVVCLVRADRDLVKMTQTPATKEARLWIGAAFDLLVGGRRPRV